MAEKSNSYFLGAAATVAILALAGCKEPNGVPSPDQSKAPAHSSSTSAPEALPVAINQYTPGKNTVALTSCNLERTDGVAFGADPVTHKAGQTHSFSGWIAAPRLSNPTYQLRFDNKQAGHYLEVTVIPSIARSDVTSVGGNEGFSPNSGFKVSVAANMLMAGRYHTYLVALVGETVYSCDDGREVVVTN